MVVYLDLIGGYKPTNTGAPPCRAAKLASPMARNELEQHLLEGDIRGI